jgi:hypothetical protein
MGIQTFEELRERNALYVDKTGYLPGLGDRGKVVFCARPRRFGKSLTVSTLDAFYTGKKELFQGLAVEGRLNSPDFTPRPVIHLDMSAVAGSVDRKILEARIIKQLAFVARRHKVALNGADSADVFLTLLRDISEACSEKPVLLVDEYDAPVLDALGKADLLAETREVMRDFYRQIKVAGASLHFTFITGISKFSRMGVFSSLNNIMDISLDSEYGAFMGYTQEELEANFGPHIEAAARALGMGEGELLDAVRERYDGFSFDGETRLYNPFSTLAFFSHKSFRNYWMESGANSFIRDFLRDKKLSVEELRGKKVSLDFASAPGEIETTTPEGFLYQAGYLSLRRAGDGFALDFPNFEVLSAMSALYVRDFFPTDSEAMTAAMRLLEHLEGMNAEGLVEEFNRLFAGISYTDHGEAERRGLGESFYRGLLQSFLLGAGVRVQSERHNNLGRMDLAAEYKGRTVIIELKTAGDEASAGDAAEEGLRQIRERDYGNAFAPPVLLLSLAVDAEKRRIRAFRFEQRRPGPEPEEEDCGPRP